MVYAMVLGGLRRCEVLGLRLGDVQVPERSLFIAEGKGGHQRVIPISNTFFAAVGDYLRHERPRGLRDGPGVRDVEGPEPRPADDRRWGRQDPAGRPRPGRAGTGDVPSAAPHLPDPAARSRAWNSKRSRPRPVTSRSSRPASTCTSPTTGSPASTGAPPSGSTPTPQPSCSPCRRSTDERRTCRRGRRGVVPVERVEPRVGRAVEHERRSWSPPCAATCCSSPRSSPRAASRSPTARCASSPAGSPPPPTSPSSPTSTARHIEDYKVWLAAQPGHEGPDAGQEHPAAPAADDPHLPRAAHRMGLARRPGTEPDPARRHPTPPRADPQVPHRPTSRRVHGRRPRPSRRRATGSSPRSSPAPACAPPSSASSPPTPSPASARRLLAPRPGRQAPQRPHDPPAPRPRRPLRRVDRHQRRPHPPPAGGSSPITTTRSTGAPCTASSPASAPSPASTTCTPTSSATPSPPKPSTAACASKPSPRCSATAPSR